MPAMKGFEPRFVDLPDYILKITREIWEGRQVGAIRRYYAADCILRTPLAITKTSEDVVRGTLETLHSFPDRRLLGEDVIWSGNDQDGFLSSHRLTSPSTHLGDGAFGPPTGRPVRMRTLADCACRNNQIYEEWLVRDHAGILRQIGLETREFAFRKVAEERERGLTPSVFTPAIDAAGSYRAPQNWAAEGDLYVDLLRRLWQDKDLSVIDRAYDEAVCLAHPGNRDGHGKAPADRFWLSYLAALPDALFSLDHMIVRSDPGRPVRCAARWAVQGRHHGHGAFGPPSGAEIYLMAISHAEIVDDRIIREWVLVDELAIWRQIAIHQG